MVQRVRIVDRSFQNFFQRTHFEPGKFRGNIIVKIEIQLLKLIFGFWVFNFKCLLLLMFHHDIPVLTPHKFREIESKEKLRKLNHRKPVAHD